MYWKNVLILYLANNNNRLRKTEGCSLFTNWVATKGEYQGQVSEIKHVCPVLEMSEERVPVKCATRVENLMRSRE